MDRHLLKLVGITYNQIESGVYAVILQEAEGSRRIPIIIGFPEAQAIECKLQEIVVPRPLTHDMIVSIMKAFDMELREIFIHKLPTGVFAAQLLMSCNGITQTIDARSSDAIALAIRVNAPIYTSSAVLDEMGFEPGEKPSLRRPARTTVQTKPTRQTQQASELTQLSIENLKKDMELAAENEDYEKAARLKEEIERREHGDSKTVIE